MEGSRSPQNDSTDQVLDPNPPVKSRSIRDCRYITFHAPLRTSSNVKYVAKYRVIDHRPTKGKNITHLMHKDNHGNDELIILSTRALKNAVTASG